LISAQKFLSTLKSLGDISVMQITLKYSKLTEWW